MKVNYDFFIDDSIHDESRSKKRDITFITDTIIKNVDGFISRFPMVEISGYDNGAKYIVDKDDLFSRIVKHIDNEIDWHTERIGEGEDFKVEINQPGVDCHDKLSCGNGVLFYIIYHCGSNDETRYEYRTLEDVPTSKGGVDK